MQSLFSTTAVHPRDRFDYWHAVACGNLVDHDSTPVCRRTFHAELLTGAIADIGLVLFETSPMSVAHTVTHAARSNTDELFICRLSTGGLKKVGDMVEFGGLLGRAPIMALNPYSSRDFVARCGRIPAPIQALNN